VPKVFLKAIPRSRHGADGAYISVISWVSLLICHRWRLIVRHIIFPCMSDQGSDDQRRDAILLRLLKMPPQPRADLAEAVRRAKGKKPTRIRAKRASAGKREPSA